MYGFKYTIFFAMYLKHIFGQVCALKFLCMNANKYNLRITCSHYFSYSL